MFEPSVMQELYTQFLNAVRGAETIVIGTHLNPDGDALGSALGLAHVLRSEGKHVEVLCHHNPPDNLRFLPGVDEVKQVANRDHYDLGIIVDLDSTERLGLTAPVFQKCTKLIVIDHHVPHEAPGDLRIINQSAAATAAILTEMLLELSIGFSPDVATCLLTGIVTDTGGFRFRNTNALSLGLSAKLVECGANMNQITEEVFQRKPLASMRLLGMVLASMEMDCDEQLAWSKVTYADFQDTSARDEDTEGFVNELLSIKTMKVAALFRETKPHWIRVSLRSRGDIDVSAVARELGGGGHRNAAGCSFDLPLEDAIQRVIPRLRECLASS